MKKYFIFLALSLIIVASFFLIYTRKEPSLTGEVVSVVNSDYIELQWDNSNIVSQKIGIATECTSAPSYERGSGITFGDLTVDCDWRYQKLDPKASSFRDYDIHGPENKLKFYIIESKIKLSPGVCRPKCMLGSAGIGWYDSCTEELIKRGDCDTDMNVVCCYQGTHEEGWYELYCDGNLISQDLCSQESQICDQRSDIFVKFTQELVKPQPLTRTEETSINWLATTKDEEGYGMGSATDLLITEAVDYVAQWDNRKQKYYGAALGVSPTGETIVTGNFYLKPYQPYFAGAKEDTEITWVGPLPEHQNFDFRRVVAYMGQVTPNQNFIVLPFDTKIKTAKQLCEESFSGVPMDQTKTIWEWDSEAQEEVAAGGGFTCEELNYGAPDFDLDPGKVYKIHITENRIWTQR
jgi:hypothetical protein